jgi:uncharacterized protein YndB with AHSA1/START domain
MHATKTKSFTHTLLTTQTPAKVFDAISNVRGWWTGYYNESFEGNTKDVGDEFIFRAGDGAHYSKHKIVEVVPNEKIVWLTTGSDFSFTEKKDEWTGTKIIFDIAEKEGKTQLTFTHEGLTEQVECYNDCAPAWTQYLDNKLAALINAAIE